MAETAITSLRPWKVCELAEKESENGVFKMLRNDATRFLATILIGTIVVNIGATALVTDAATAIFGEAGVSAATGVMTVAVLLLTEITPKSLAVHNATEVARFVLRSFLLHRSVAHSLWHSFVILLVASSGQASCMALVDTISRGKSCYLLVNGNAKTAWSEGEKDMIENVLEIKDTYVREVMTPLVDVVAIDASSTLIDFHNLWVTHQYSRVPVFEQRVDNLVGFAYAMDLLDYVQKGELLESSTVGDMAHKPAYFVPDSMSLRNLLREFRIRKVHMAVVLNEYGGTVGHIVTLEDVVEEIVGEIFDENDSNEEIQKKTGYIVMWAEGVHDVDANTSIDQLSEYRNIKMPEDHQYETVSGFVCEVFGYIARTGDSIEVVVKKENMEGEHEYSEDGETAHKDSKEKETHQIFKLKIVAGNARKVNAVRFEWIDGEEGASETKEVTRVVPKIMKRKWSSDDDEYSFPQRPDSNLSDDYWSDQN